MSYTDAYDFVTGFYASKSGHNSASNALKTGQCQINPMNGQLTVISLVGELTAAVTSFPQQVVIALAHVMKYLSTFKVADALLETRFFTKFAQRTHMLLNGNTLTNLYVIPFLNYYDDCSHW